MRRHRRAIGFAIAAAVCAGLAAGAVGGAPGDPTDAYGELRDVLVTIRPLPARRPIGKAALATAVEVRRIPDRFVPPGALSVPAQIAGRSPSATVPPGTYVLASAFDPPDGAARRPAPIDRAHQPVEIGVSAAGALATASAGRLVDVVVTTEPGPGGGPGRTYVAASAVGLLGLRSGGDPASGGVLGAGEGAWTATLALTHRQALRVIQAESFARSVRVIASTR